MATYRVLGQYSAAATTNADLFTATVPTVISSLTVCNRSGTATTYRIAVRPAGAVIGNSQYIAYDAPITGNDYVVLTIGVTLAATDVITIYAGAATLSFGAYGVESP